jgi:hypothetical protein
VVGHPERKIRWRHISSSGRRTRPAESLSTDVPPDPGTAPDVGALDKEGLQAELARVQAEGHLQDVDPKANKADLQDSLRKYHGQEA